MNDEWYYLHGANCVGPYPAASIRAALDARTLSPDTLVWRNGMHTWTPIRATREICTPSIPPPPPRVAVSQDGSPGLAVPKPFRIVGSYVYLAEGHQLPDSHCVCCGLPSTKRRRKNFGFTPVVVWFAIIVPLVLIILLCCLHKSRSLRFGLCDEHAKSTLIKDIICWTCGLGFLPLLLMAVSSSSSSLSTLWGVLGTVAFITCIVFCNLPRPLKIVGLENGYIKLNGVCNALKQSLKG
jgi:hypothetical protein